MSALVDSHASQGQPFRGWPTLKRHAAVALAAATVVLVLGVAPHARGATTHRCHDIGSHMDRTLKHFPTLTRIRVVGTGCATPRAFASQLHKATYQGDEDAMWRRLATMTDPLGRRYRCFYQGVLTDTLFYTRMVCRHGHLKVNAWVNSST